MALFNLCFNTGKFDVGLEWLDKAEECVERQYGKNSQEVCNFLSYVANYYNQANRFSDAKRYISEVRKRIESQNDEMRKRISQSSADINLAKTHINVGECKKAEKLCGKVIKSLGKQTDSIYDK